MVRQTVPGSGGIRSGTPVANSRQPASQDDEAGPKITMIGDVGETICRQGYECPVTGNLVRCHANSCKL